MLFEVIEADKQERINRRNDIEEFTPDYFKFVFTRKTQLLNIVVFVFIYVLANNLFCHCFTQINKKGLHKNVSLSFSAVGMTRFELATTGPPDM